ncbi:MAG: protein kinase family protein, partial [Verrucomicrobia bacterium]|nr:protein kinase family protein [Verrucomicrobiota bacterium]
GLIIGLQEMKAKNIVHRDLHAGNVALTYDDKWVIHDFGFAKTEGEKIAPGGPLHISIASPQIIEDLVFKRESTASAVHDAWALGIVLYEADSGFLPRFDPELRALSQAIKSQNQTEINSAHETYKHALDAFKEEVAGSTLALRDVILDLLEAKALNDCFTSASSIPMDLDETVGIVKTSESTEDLTGYQTTEQLNNLFGAIPN